MRGKFVRKTVGLLGGSFNPAHDGHRYISVQALKLLKLDEIWWLVSPLNPLKQAKDMASYERRLESARTAACHPRIKVSNIEREIGTHYTFDTISKLKEMYPDICFVWLMGADNLLEFHHWHRWRSIMRLVPIAIFDRKNYAPKALCSAAARLFHFYRLPHEKAADLAFQRPPAWMFLPIRKHPASATEIRQKGLFQTGEEECP